MDLKKYLDMLTYKRPDGSVSEYDFIRKFIAPLGARVDGFGNRLLTVGHQPNILWSAHTDTVHRKGGRQRLRIRNGIVDARYSDCLGADNGSGIWLLTEMIRHRVPGLYVFHRAEEVGCQGSSYILHETPEVLDGIDYAIAFDRRGVNSIVTHQVGKRTASDAFAWSLRGALGIDTLSPDPTGVFTDTEMYCERVPECTNVSVGYGDGHRHTEYQDLRYLVDLRDALCSFNPSGLVVARDPSIIEDDEPAWWTRYNWTGASGDTIEVFTCALCETECEEERPHQMAGHDVCEECWDESWDDAPSRKGLALV